MARALQAGGVVPGDRVAFIGASGPEFVEVLYGTAKCRAIVTAVNNRLSAREVLVTDGGYQAWDDAAPAEDPSQIAGPDETALIPSLARTASGKLQKQAIRASLSSVAVR